jgi:formylglycine-generating enzyme required for sulfatase activity
MSSLRGRTRDSSWQWLVIGIVLGLGCSSVVCLAGYAINWIHFNLPGQTPDFAGAVPTLGPTVIVVTSTPPLETAASVASAVPSAAMPTTAAGNTNPVLPTLTPYPLQFTGIPTVPQPTNQAMVASPTAAGTIIPSPVPATVAPTEASGSQPGGGIFEMGTTPKEVQQAVDDCVSRDKGKCDVSMAEDSFPAHNVTVNTFRMEKYEVSTEQFVAFLNYLGPKSHLNQCEGQPCAAVKDKDHPYSNIQFDGTTYQVGNEIYRNRPAAYVTWYGADAFCKAIGRRLPTEAEWERAARDPDKRIYPWGNDWDPAKARTSKPKNEGGPDTVDSYKNGVSADGIFNLAGNVSEWVYDWYGPSYYKTLAANPAGAIDPKGPVSGSTKVTRGGDWDAAPFFARSVHRRDADPLIPTASIGFRCAADADLSKPATTKSQANPGSAASPAAAVPGKATATFTPGPLASGSGGQ